MNTAKFYTYTTLFLLVLGTLFSSKLSAQNLFGTPLKDVTIKTNSESPNAASYTLSGNGFSMNVSLRKTNDANILVQLRMNGKKWGSGRAFINNNGAPGFNFATAYKGTHGAWVFAMSKIACIKGKLALVQNRSERRKIARDCFNKCKRSLLSRPVVVAFAANTRLGDNSADNPPMFMQVVPRPQLTQAQQKFLEFLDCLCGCISDSVK